MEDQKAQAANAAEQPMNHAFVLFGKDANYMAHSAMFLTPEHAYQAIVAASLDSEGQILVDVIRDGYPDALILALSTVPQLLDQLLRGSFQVDLYKGSIDSSSKLGTATVTVERLVYYVPLNQYAPNYPAALTYFIYGRNSEVFMSHLITKRPNFHHEISLTAPPSFISPDDLEKGVLVTVDGMQDGFWDQDPLPNSVPLIGPDGARGSVNILRRDRFTYKVLNGDD